MSRFIVSLTDDRRAKLENVRKFRGFRSLAEVVSQLIDEAEDGGLSAGITLQAISFEDRREILSDRLPLAPKAEVEKLKAQARPAVQVPELQVGPIERTPGSLAKKGKR